MKRCQARRTCTWGINYRVQLDGTPKRLYVCGGHIVRAWELYANMPCTVTFIPTGFTTRMAVRV